MATTRASQTRDRFHPRPDWQSGDVFLSRGAGVTSRPLLGIPLPKPPKKGRSGDLVGDDMAVPTLLGFPIPPEEAATGVLAWLARKFAALRGRIKGASGRSLSDSIVWIDGGPFSHGSIGIRGFKATGRDVSLDVGNRAVVVSDNDVDPYFEQRVNLHVLRHVAMLGPDPTLTPGQVQAEAEALADTYNNDPQRGFAMWSLTLLGLRMFTLNDDKVGPVERLWKRFLERVITSDRSNDTFCTGFVAQVFDRVGHPLLVVVDPGYIEGLRAMRDRGPLGDDAFLTRMSPPGLALAANGRPAAAQQIDDLLNRTGLQSGPIELAFTDDPGSYSGPGEPVPTLLCTPRLAHDSHSLRMIGRVFPDAASL